MQPGQEDEWLKLAEGRRAQAERLLRTGRFREALSFLNSAIQLAPDYPSLFATRALIFEQLGMLPQAAADRRRAEQLAKRYGLPAPEPPPLEPEPEPPEEPALEPEPDEEAVEPEPAPATPLAEAQPSPAPSPPVPRAVGIRDGPGWGPILGALGSLAFIIGLFVGVVLVAMALLGGDDDGLVESPDGGNGGEPTESAGATPEATTPPPIANVQGSPLSLSDLQSAWTGAGLQVSGGDTPGGFSGFDVAPVEAHLSRGGEEVDVAVLVYREPSAAASDWNLPAGERPSPKEGRVVPGHTSIWWNQNIVIVVLSGSGSAYDAAFNAFLTL